MCFKVELTIKHFSPRITHQKKYVCEIYEHVKRYQQMTSDSAA